MATTEKTPEAAGGMQGVLNLLDFLGGQQTTTSPGNIAPLQGTLKQLQGQDFNAMLQSIFQQAGGQIPGLQAAYGNAIGARSGGNSAVQAALNELLKQTTLAGQQQIAGQQAQNLQTQTQAGSAIANATKGTKQTQGTDLEGALLKLLMGQGANQLFKMFSGGTQQAPAPVAEATPMAVGTATDAGFTPPVATASGAPLGTMQIGAPATQFMFTDPAEFSGNGFGYVNEGDFASVFPDFSGEGIDYSGMFSVPTTDYGLGNYSFDNQDFTNLDFTQPGGGLY